MNSGEIYKKNSLLNLQYVHADAVKKVNCMIHIYRVSF